MFGKNRARVSVLFDEDDVASSSRVDVVLSPHKRSNTSEAKKIQFRQLIRDEFRLDCYYLFHFHFWNTLIFRSVLKKALAIYAPQITIKIEDEFQILLNSQDHIQSNLCASIISQNRDETSARKKENKPLVPPSPSWKQTPSKLTNKAHLHIYVSIYIYINTRVSS